MSNAISEKTLTLKHTGYEVIGTALLNLWGGGQGSIQMDKIFLNSIPEDLSKIKYNDGRFGCESIEQVEIEIYESYEGVLVFVSEHTVKLK